MRNVLPICAGLVVISGIVLATMWRELRSEQQLVEELKTQLADSNVRLQASLAKERSVVQQSPMTAPAANASDAKEAAPPPPTAATVAASMAGSIAPALKAVARDQEMMADPEYRKARMAQQRMSFERSYPALAEELGLSPKEADRLFDMLVENQMTMNNELSARLGGTPPDPATRAELMRRTQEMRRQQEDQVAAMLGAGRYTQWQAYRETQGGRQQAIQFSTQLAQVGQPLSDVQQRGLTTVLVAEQKRLQQSLESLTRNVNPADNQLALQVQEQASKLREESNSRVLDAAAAHLTARQIATLRQQFETQAAMNAAQRRLQPPRPPTQ